MTERRRDAARSAQVLQHLVSSGLQSPVLSRVLVFVLSRQLQVNEGYLGCKLTDIDHLLQTLGTDSVQTAQQFGFPAAGVVAVVADFALQFLQSVDQRLSPRLNLNAA